MSDKEFMNNLQQIITIAGIEHIKIHRVQKTLDHRLKIWCKSDKEAEELSCMDWKKILKGGDVIETLYDIVIHEISNITSISRAINGRKS